MATADTQSALDQLQATAAAAVDNAGQGLNEYANEAQAQLAKLLRNYLSQFQDYIGETGELAITAVLSVADATTNTDGGVLRKRETAEQDMMAALSVSLANRLKRFADLLEQHSVGGDDDETARELIRQSLQAELDRLVMVPFGVPLLHEIGRSYARVSDTWRGNLVVQGIKNLADAVSHKVSAVTGAVSLGLMKQDLDATGDHAAAIAEKAQEQANGGSSSSSHGGATQPASGFKSHLLQPQEQYAPMTTTDVGTAAAASLDSAAAKALWVEEHLAEVINALWRLLRHDLDRVLRGAADGALRSIQSSERDLGAVSVQEAARILGIMANIFQAALRPFAPGPPAAVDAHTMAAVAHGNLALAAASAMGGVESVLPLEEYQVPGEQLPQQQQQQQQQQEGAGGAISDVSKALGPSEVDQVARKVAAATDQGAAAADSAATGVDKGVQQGRKAAKAVAGDAGKVTDHAAREAAATAETAAAQGSSAVTAAVDEGSAAAVDTSKVAATKLDAGVKEAGKQAEATAVDAGKVARDVTDAAADATDQAAGAVAAAAPEVADVASRKTAAAGEAAQGVFDIHDEALAAAVDVSKDVSAAAKDAVEGGAAAAHGALDKGTPIVLDTIDESAPEINKAAAVAAEEAKKVTQAAGQAVEQSVDAAATAVEEVATAAATETTSVVDQYSAAAVAGVQSLKESTDTAIASTPAAADSAAAAGLKSVTPGVITAADQVQIGAEQLRGVGESAPQLVQQMADKFTTEVLDKQGHDGVDKMQQKADRVADLAKQQVQEGGQAAADKLRSAAAGAAAALPVVAEDVAREAGNVKDVLVPQVITPAGAEVSKTLSSSTAQAAAAAAAAASTAADTLPQLAHEFVEGSLKPAAAAAADQLPAAVDKVGGKLIEQEAQVVSEGIITTSRLLGTGTGRSEGGDGLLSIAADTARVAPEAVKEYDQEVLLPAVKDIATDVVELAKGAQSQADLVLGRLASSCRTQDPKLLNELRGELLYMARCIKEPVSSARDALKSADIPGQAQQLEEQLVPAAKEAAAAVEEGVAAAAPELADNLDELAGLVTQEGQEVAEQIQDNAGTAHEKLASAAADLSEKLVPAADQAGAVLVSGADSAAAVVHKRGDDVATGVREAGAELGSAAAAATQHASKAVTAAADAAASAAATAADTARQQQQQQQGLAAAGAVAADSVECVTSGVIKGLNQGVKEVGLVGHQGVEEAKQGAEQATGAATTAAGQLADSSNKAATALTSAADKLRGTAESAAAAADSSSSGSGAAKDAAATAAGKTAAVVGSTGDDLAAAVGDAAAAIPQPATAAATAVGDAASKVGEDAAAAAQRIADSARGDVVKGLDQSVTEAPAAAAAAVTEVVNDAAAAGSDQSKVAAGEAESAVDVLVTGVKDAAGKMSEALGVQAGKSEKGGSQSVTSGQGGKDKLSEIKSGGKSEGVTAAPGLEDVAFATIVSNEGDAVIRDQDQAGNKKSERGDGSVSYAAVVAGAPAGAETH